MHLLFLLLSLLVVAVAGSLVLRTADRHTDWARRRELQLGVLAGPVITIAAATVAFVHFATQVCFLGAPPWDTLVAGGVSGVTAWLALAALGYGAVRVLFMQLILGRKGAAAEPWLQEMAGTLADRLGAPRPSVLVYRHDRPLALTYGFIRPKVLLSTWMVENLDTKELEAVVAHEVGHVARRDYLAGWVATMLRDAFFYLPASRGAHRRLRQDNEPACDDIAVTLTGRPLALASALAKVWQNAAEGPRLQLAQAISGPTGSRLVESRLERLVAHPAQPTTSPRTGNLALKIIAPALAGLAAQAGSMAFLLASMGCALPTSGVFG